MLCLCCEQMQSQCVLLWTQLRMPMKPATMASPYGPSSICRKSSVPSATATAHRPPVVLISKQETPNSVPLAFKQSLTSGAPPIQAVKDLGFRPTPELGLVFVLSVLSMALAAFFSVAVVSIPTMIALGRLAGSVKKLSKIVSEEVPGTLSSLKLSSMELNELTQQLSNLRHKISGVRVGKKDRS